MANDSYFWFDYDNRMKFKYSHNHHKINGWIENKVVYIEMIEKMDWILDT